MSRWVTHRKFGLAESRKKKHDRRDADFILKLLVKNRFPSIWRPSKELVDLRALLPSSVGSDADADTECTAGDCAGERFTTGPALWSQAGQRTIASFTSPSR
jgi:hypothetical protein